MGLVMKEILKKFGFFFVVVSLSHRNTLTVCDMVAMFMNYI